MNTAPFNRHVGLLILDVTMSNPNGDPDMESEPRIREFDRLGMISPVSLKRKYRDLVEGDSLVFREVQEKFGLGSQSGNQFEILESRGRDRDKIIKLKGEEFKKKYWDARIFGNTYLEGKKLSDEDKQRKKKGELDHLINTGVTQIGVGLSVAPIDVIRMTYTNKAGVEDDKDRGMAPLGFRVVSHAIYYMPFYVNPCVAVKTGATEEDLNLFKFITPHVYNCLSSAIRPQVSILHAWCAEHKNALGSCPEYLLIDALTPKLKENIDKPTSRAGYDIPKIENIPEEIRAKFKDIVDLNKKEWN
jgi:CRISPR-associated protein Csd2